MKKLLMIAAVALLSTGAAFACDGKKKDCCKKGEKKECHKDADKKADASKTTTTNTKTLPAKKA
jgi:Ni/Co efflux regulator RcnB